MHWKASIVIPEINKGEEVKLMENFEFEIEEMEEVEALEVNGWFVAGAAAGAVVGILAC